SADKIYNDYVLPQLNSIIEIQSKDIYYSGEDINATIKILYNSPYYIPDALFVVQLIRIHEEGSIYPSDIVDHNVFYEKIYNINLKPGDIININFNYKLPPDIAEGKYYIVAYLYTPLSYISGLPFIFLPGNYKEFYVKSGKNVGFPYVRIYRKESKINSENPTIGAFTKDMVKLEVAILSDINTEAKIIVKYAPWDDISRNVSILSEKVVNLNEGINYFNFDYYLEFLDPNVYSIRVEVYINETLQSLYRFRFIKSGSTALLRGILLDKDRNLLIIVGPSPDHYLYPITDNVKLIVESKELEYKKEIYIGRLDYLSSGFIYVNLSLDDKIKESFDICSYLYVENKLTDKYCINYSEIKPKPFFDIDFSEGILKIKTTVSGLLIIDYLDKNITYTRPISSGLNEISLDHGKYFITFISDEIYLEKEISYHPKEEKTIILLDDEMIFVLFISLLILFLILIIIIMIRILLKGKKEILKVIIFLLTFLFISRISYSLKVSLEDPSFCSINGSIEIEIENKIGNYNVFAKIYDNQTEVYEFSYSCEDKKCVINLNLPYLYPKEYILNLLIEVEGDEYEERNFTLFSLYPYDIKLLYNTIYTGAKTAAVINNVSKCQNLENYTEILFNFTSISTSGIFRNIRRNCPYSGDPEWGERICGLDVSLLSEGKYEIYANYTIEGFRFFQPIGLLEIIKTDYYIFRGWKCKHAWSAQGIGAQYSYSIIGEYTIDEDLLVLANGSTFSIKNINSINYLCSNAVLEEQLARIFGFVYEGILSLENYSRGKFIYGKDNSVNYFGSEVGNIMLEIYKNNRDRGFIIKRAQNIASSFDLYTFRSEGYYTIFINQINAICDSPAVFVCPATEDINNLCRIGVYNSPIYYVGWRNLNQYKILVPFPDVTGTYTEEINAIPYFNEKEGKWYLYVLNYTQSNYKEGINYTISNHIPADFVIIGKFKNIGYGKVNITVNSSHFRAGITVKDNETRIFGINLTDPIIRNCYKRECSIKFDIKYSDTYGLVGEFYLADPYININWNKIAVDLIEPGYLHGSFIVILLNITNLGLVTAQNVSLINHNASECIIIRGEDPINIEPYENKTYRIFIGMRDTNCPREKYIVNLKVGGINTLDSEIIVNIENYLEKIIKYREKIIVEEKIPFIGILLIILLILLLL
ncbi:MAG: hypothetical protein QXP34_02745, partial [Candidatus Aenigmatarchaeota archaeon]